MQRVYAHSYMALGQAGGLYRCVLCAMSRSHWSACRAVARGGLILVSVALLHGNIIPNSEAQNGNQTTQKHQPAQTQQGPSIGVVQQSVEYKPDCSKPPTNSDADYCVELRSTRATERQATLGLWQVVLSGLGVAGVVGSLVFTAQAAGAAAKAANIAERAMIEIERPWMIFEEAQIKWRDTPNNTRLVNDWFVSFTFKNIGKIPAEILECCLKIEAKLVMQAIPDSGGSVPLTLKAIFAVDEKATTNPVGPKPGWEKELVVFGRVSYRGLNGTKGVTGFAISVAPMFPAFVSYGDDKYNYHT
jgi:hypothetical protein